LSRERERPQEKERDRAPNKEKYKIIMSLLLKKSKLNKFNVSSVM